MADSYGRNLHLTIYGGSHDEKIGMTLAGLPQGFNIDQEELQAFLARRLRGATPWAPPAKKAMNRYF